MKYISTAKNGSRVEVELSKISHVVQKGNDITVHLKTGLWLHYYGREEYGANILKAWCEYRNANMNSQDLDGRQAWLA